MLGLAERVRRFLECRLTGGGKLGLAVSGGVDSLVLMRLVHDHLPSDVTLTVLHFDHALRPDSASDADFVRDQAKMVSLAFHGERWDHAGDVSPLTTTGMTASQVAASSMAEDTARKARYAFFARAAAQLGLNAIATAHTADDQAETMLMRLLRGTGRRGLCGMAPAYARDGYLLLRPFLEARRSDLELYASQHGLLFREDPTNESLTFTRNRMRHQVLPFLKKHVAGDLVESLCRTAEILRAEDDLLEQWTRDELEQWRSEGERRVRAVQALRTLPPAIQARAILRTLEMLNAAADHDAVEMVRAVLENGGRVDLEGGVAAWVEQDSGRTAQLALGRQGAGSESLRAEFPLASAGVTFIEPLGLSVRLSPEERHPGVTALVAAPFGRPRSSGAWRAQVWFSAVWIDRPLVLRTRREGDRITPLGMSGSRKLHDVFIDCKAPLVDRDRWPLITCGDEVLWIVGLRQSESTRVGDGDSTALRIEVSTENPDDASEGRSEPKLVA